MDRVQKYIAKSGLCSRRKAEELIRDGRVRVNGRVITLGDKASQEDEITVDGVPIEPEDYVYYLFYKPEGVVSTTHDEKGRKHVLDYVKSDRRIYPVGRLDYDTSGLLLLTNDGDATVALTHPSYDIEKEYEVTVEGFVRRKTSRAMAHGPVVDGERMKPARIRNVEYIKKSGRTRLNIIVSEGRYHHVKRLFEAFNHTVKRLKRVRMGPIVLDGLSPGEYRPLSPHERKRLFQTIKAAKDAA